MRGRGPHLPGDPEQIGDPRPFHRQDRPVEGLGQRRESPDREAEPDQVAEGHARGECEGPVGSARQDARDDRGEARPRRGRPDEERRGEDRKSGGVHDPSSRTPSCRRGTAGRKPRDPRLAAAPAAGANIALKRPEKPGLEGGWKQAGNRLAVFLPERCARRSPGGRLLPMARRIDLRPSPRGEGGNDVGPVRRSMRGGTGVSPRSSAAATPAPAPGRAGRRRRRRADPRPPGPCRPGRRRRPRGWRRPAAGPPAPRRSPPAPRRS